MLSGIKNELKPDNNLILIKLYIVTKFRLISNVCIFYNTRFSFHFY